ncbi:MMPL family transporter [Verrucomicrobiales bacterium]|nr:MMPL family transporter [Verrucomicrobiales bacterium]
MLVALIVLGALGLSRIRLSTDILDVLPENVAGVEALQRLQAQAESQNQLVLIFEADADQPLPDDEAFGALASKLEEVPGTKRVQWQEGVGDIEEEAEARGDWGSVVAYLWANSDPEIAAEKLGYLNDPAAVQKQLKRTIRRLATSLDEVEVAKRSYDPLGLLDHPFITEMLENAPSFLSEDGMARIVLITPESELAGYKDFGAWSDDVRTAVRSELPDARFLITGAPAISAEVGRGLEGDLAGTMSVTAVLVGLLFLFFQRSPRQLFALLVCLTLTIAGALGICGWIWGTLSLVSGGFAAILLGLCVDYAMVVGREITLEGDVAKGQKRATTGVFWAALTTASVFGACMMSTLPGVRQLGGLVAIGLIAGALVMVIVYPVIAFPGNAKKPVRKPLILPLPILTPRAATSAVTIGLVAITAALAFKGLPGLDFDPARFRPENSEAQKGYMRLQAHFPEWGEEAITLLVLPEVLARTSDPAAERAAFEAEVALLEADGLVRSLTIPYGTLPFSDRFPSQDFFAGMLESEARITTAITDAGFNDKATAFFTSVSDAMKATLQKSPSAAYASVSMNPVIEQAVLPPDGIRGVLRLESERGGLISLSDHDAIRSLDRPWLSAGGWPLLRHDVVPILSADSWRVSVPVIFVLTAALFVVFRNVRDTFTAIVIMVLCLGAVTLLVRSTAGVWNLTSVLCIPLLAGTGVDYIIHIIFALRREGGDIRRVLSGTGMAVLFCALSTAIGFGALLFASNNAIKDLGLVASGGILIIGTGCLLLVPALWRGRAKK